MTFNVQPSRLPRYFPETLEVECRPRRDGNRSAADTPAQCKGSDKDLKGQVRLLPSYLHPSAPLASSLSPLPSRLFPLAAHTRRPGDVAMQRLYGQPSCLMPLASCLPSRLSPRASSPLASHTRRPGDVAMQRLYGQPSCLMPLASRLAPHPLAPRASSPRASRLIPSRLSPHPLAPHPLQIVVSCFRTQNHASQ